MPHPTRAERKRRAARLKKAAKEDTFPVSGEREITRKEIGAKVKKKVDKPTGADQTTLKHRDRLSQERELGLTRGRR